MNQNELMNILKEATKKIEANRTEAEDDKPTSTYPMATKAILIHPNNHFKILRAKIENDKLTTKNYAFQIVSPPMQWSKAFTTRSYYFCSTTTGTTINFQKLFSEVDQIDAVTRRAWFNRQDFNNALKSLKPDPMQNLIFIIVGLCLGFVLAMFIGGL